MKDRDIKLIKGMESVDVSKVQEALINLYLYVKYNKTQEPKDIKYEIEQLKDIELIVLIGYIKTSIEILIDLRSEDSEVLFTKERSITSVQKEYNEMLQNLENEVRMHIRVIVQVK
jgi:hypothetical protein